MLFCVQGSAQCYWTWMELFYFTCGPHEGKAVDIQCNKRTRSHIHFALTVAMTLRLSAAWKQPQWTKDLKGNWRGEEDMLFTLHKFSLNCKFITFPKLSAKDRLRLMRGTVITWPNFPHITHNQLWANWSLDLYDSHQNYGGPRIREYLWIFDSFLVSGGAESIVKIMLACEDPFITSHLTRRGWAFNIPTHLTSNTTIQSHIVQCPLMLLNIASTWLQGHILLKLYNL